MMNHCVLAIDPGKTTGVAFLEWSGDPDESPVRKYSGELSADEFAPVIRQFLDSWKTYGYFQVVCERFIINAQTVRNSQAPFSLEQIGVLKQLCRDHSYPVDGIKMQAPVDAKNMFPNPALKTIGTWHVGGEGHANDAIRHGLLHLVKMKWIPKDLLQRKNTDT
jgi:hypothetical protein